MSQPPVKVSFYTPCRGQPELVMDAAELKGLLLSVKRLTGGQRAELLATLDAGGRDEEVRSLLESRSIEEQACPHCNGVWTRPQRQRQQAATLQMPGLPPHLQRAEHHPAGQASHEGQVAAPAGRVAAGLERPQGRRRAGRGRHAGVSLASPLLAIGAGSQGVGADRRGRGRRDLLPAIQQRPTHGPQAAQAGRVRIAQRTRPGLASSAGGPRPVGVDG